MSQDSDSLTGAPAAGIASVLLITAFFGALWGLVGASALPDGFSSPAIVLVVVVTAVLLLAVVRLSSLPQRSPDHPAGTNPFRTRPYLLAVLFEAIAIPLAGVLLNYAGYPGAVISAVAVIVGLHFFGLIPAFKSWRFAAVGGSMVSVGLLSLMLPAAGVGGTSPRGALVGLGCALVLWVGALQPLISTRRRAGARSD